MHKSALKRSRLNIWLNIIHGKQQEIQIGQGGKVQDS
jgi:hypothetical protein